MIEFSLFGFVFEISTKTIAILSGILVALVAIIIQILKRPAEEKLVDRFQGNMETSQKFFYEKTTYKTKYGKFYGRYLRDYFRNENGILYKLVQAMKLDPNEIDRKLNLVKSDFTVEEFISIKILAFIIGGIMLVFGLLTSAFAVLVIGFVLFYLGIAGFDKILIDSKLKRRNKLFERSLPNFLDLLYSACKVGHTITEGIIKVSTKYNGIVADEFKKCMVDMKGNGGNFRNAMEDMANRNNIESLSDVVSDIVIAFEKGDEQIINVLKDEANYMRELVNAEFEETANKKSATLILPMLIFSFAPIFAFILIPLFSQFMVMFN